MLDEIKANLANPEMLEKLYRDDQRAFKDAFNKIYAEIESTEPAKFWKARLDYDRKPEILKTLKVLPVWTSLIHGKSGNKLIYRF